MENNQNLYYYSAFIQWLLKMWFSAKGWFISKRLVKNQTYFGGINNLCGIYMGDNTFYVQQECTDNLYGVQYYSTKQEKYTYLQLGLFKWSKINITNVYTD